MYKRRERKGNRGGKKDAVIRMKITRGERAGDRNEGRVRWETVKHDVEDQKGWGE